MECTQDNNNNKAYVFEKWKSYTINLKATYVTVTNNV